MNNQIIRVAGIVDGTSVDGPGLRTSIYVAGCRHRCPGCHNPGTWDFDAGEYMTVEALLDRIKDNGCNVTLSGGDPIYSASALIPLAQGVRELGLTLWCYSGFTFEDIEHMGGDAARLLDSVDVLVDGPYVEALRDIKLRFRGSSNQRLVDVQASRRQGETVLYQFDF